MDLTITIPAHVAAAFPDADAAEAFALAALTAEAQAQALAAANDAAQQLLRDAAAPFATDTPPEVPTLAERVAAIDDDQAALRGQVREVGVALAVAAGVPLKDAAALIEDALAT